MINYQLAKELKEAGFPFKRYSDPFFEEGSYEVSPMMPTLSELIEVCGDGFWSLDRLPMGELNIRPIDWRCIGFDTNNHKIVTDRYDSPEEAVAKLYLALHNK